MQTHDTCLITGGTGTFGSSYLITALREKWHKKIIIFSRDEYKQVKLKTLLGTFFDLETPSKLDFSCRINNCDIRFFIGDIRNYERVSLALNGVDLVIHSAALKHVPVCEYNVEEAISTNITGTLNIVKAAHFQKVKNVICLSTDKAVDPINLYGATKMCLEKTALNYRFMAASETTYSVVRYGNVIASRGSLIEKLLNPNEFPTVTDPGMTRFWMQIEDSIQLVRKSLQINLSGSIIVPQMKALSISKTFQYLRPDLDLTPSGSRIGEKKHECILSEAERPFSFSCPTFSLISTTPLDKISSILKTYNLKPVKKEKYCSSQVAPFECEEFKHLVSSTIVNQLSP